ncbi:MAG: NYN domain-containing protein [Candidatus Altiarchaeota archaeon]
MKRAVIFIDGSNFYHSCLDSLGAADVNFGKFAAKLCRSYELVEIRYYNASINQQMEPEKYREQQRFFAKVAKIPKVKLILGKLKARFETCTQCSKKTRYFVEKNTDVNIAIDLVDLAHKNVYDIAVMVTGDGDFSGAVRLVRTFSKEVEHARFRKNYSTELNRACNREIILDEEYMRDCLL